MQVKTIVSGELDNNTYVVINNDEAVIVDSSASIQELEEVLNGARVQGVLLTHAHFDHITNLPKILKHFNTKCYLSKNAPKKFGDVEANASFLSKPFTISVDEGSLVYVKGGDKINLAGLTFDVLDLPGHTDCGLGFVVEDVLFSGDTMFNGGYGRTDLKTSSYKDLLASLKVLFKNYKGYRLLSGHGSEGIIK